MKKFLSIVLLSLLFGGSALSECIKGDCKNGYGEFSWKGLGIYKGEFLKNKMHGYGEYEGYSDGSHAGLTHKGYYKNDKKHGDGKFTFPDGAIFEGEYRNNKMKIGKFTFPDGAIFEGEFSNDRMKLGRYVWPNGDICEEFNGSECLVNIINKEKLKKQKAKEEKLKAKKKAEEEKLEAKRKAEEVKLAAKQKAKEEEEKKRLLEEKIKQQKALDEKKLSLLPAKPKEEKAKKTLIDIQKFIKNNPNEFDILEISEFFIKTKPILENSFNDQLEKDLNSLIEYVKKSKNFQSYLREIEFKEREKNLKYIDEKLSLINKQIAKVTNFLYEKPNSIHAKNWLNSVKKAKQKLNNFNSFEEILSSSNELGTIIINKEILVKSNSESEKLIIELKGYLANNLTTDLTPKILEQIENIKKSVETENVNKINMANEKASNFINKIFLEPKKKAEKKKAKEKKLATKQKAKEEEERKKQVEKPKLETSGRLKCHMTYMANLNTDYVKDVSNVRPRSYFYFIYDKTSLKIDWTNDDGTRSNEVLFIKDFKKIWKEEHNGYTLVYEYIEKSSTKLHSEIILGIDTWSNKAVASATSKISYLNFVYECNKP